MRTQPVWKEPTATELINIFHIKSSARPANSFKDSKGILTEIKGQDFFCDIGSSKFKFCIRFNQRIRGKQIYKSGQSRFLDYIRIRGEQIYKSGQSKFLDCIKDGSKGGKSGTFIHINVGIDCNHYRIVWDCSSIIHNDHSTSKNACQKSYKNKKIKK